MLLNVCGGKRQGFGQLQCIVLNTITEKNSGVCWLTGKVILPYPTVGASGKATQRVDNWAELLLLAWHAEIPGPGVESMPQWRPEQLQWQCQILNPLSHTVIPGLSFLTLSIYSLFLWTHMDWLSPSFGHCSRHRGSGTKTQLRSLVSWSLFSRCGEETICEKNKLSAAKTAWNVKFYGDKTEKCILTLNHLNSWKKLNSNIFIDLLSYKHMVSRQQ